MSTKCQYSPTISTGNAGSSDSEPRNENATKISSIKIPTVTCTPWNPVIWPVKAAIPAAGLLLLLQGFSNLFRDLGWVQGGQSR